jgi:hypothetical protein
MKVSLEKTVREYVAKMTSIRGRRVHRLLMREFSRFDHVLPVTAQDGTPALFAVAKDGSVSVCRTDGRGAAAAVAEWARLDGATITISYDLLKDSLPIESWTIWHPSFAQAAGALTISADSVPRTDHSLITDILRSTARASIT